MSDDGRSLLIPTMVFLGATVLVGLPAMGATMFVLNRVVGAALNVVGVNEVPAVGGVLLFVISILVALQIAVEAVALQLGGVEALGRGSPRVSLARYVFLSLCVFIVLATATWVGLRVVFAGFGWAYLIPGVLLGCAGFLVLYRSSQAFITGLRGNEA